MCYTEDDLVIRTSELVIHKEIKVKNLHELKLVHIKIMEHHIHMTYSFDDSEVIL
jgi:hypothetical protein